MEQIKTRVHPLNEELAQAVEGDLPKTEACQVIFSEQERPDQCIKVLTLNTQLLPTFPEDPRFPSGGQHSRLADLFVHQLHNFDIVCLQEVWGALTSELKETTMMYA